MKRAIRIDRQININVEMTEHEANCIRLILWYLTDEDYERILERSKSKHTGEIKETVQELCSELEIFPGDSE